LLTPADDAGEREFRLADGAAADPTPPAPERLDAPPMQTRVEAPVPAAADHRARNEGAYPAGPPATGLDAPDADSSTYIHIGRVELHATPPSAPPRRANLRPAHQPMSLDEYLRRRKGTPR
jgi:hypothetical protein